MELEAHCDRCGKITDFFRRPDGMFVFDGKASDGLARHRERCPGGVAMIKVVTDDKKNA